MPSVAYTDYTAIKDTQLNKDDATTSIDYINGTDTSGNAVKKTIAYQQELEKVNATQKTLLDEIDGNLQYTVMSMTIWVPLAAIAGYYLYKRNFSVPGIPGATP